MAWERTGVTLLLLLIQNILIGLKLDAVLHSSWWAVFVPAYVWAGIMLLIVGVAWYHFCALLQDDEEEEEFCVETLATTPRNGEMLSQRRAFYFGMVAMLVLVLVILVAVRAEGHKGVPWSVIFIPIYLYLFILLLVVVHEGSEYTRGTIERGPLDAIPGISSWVMWFWLLNLLVWGTIFIILLAVKLDGGLQPWNYWAVLSPLWVLLITAAVLAVSSIPFLLLRQLELRVWQLFFYMIAYIAAVLALIFIILRADKTTHWDWSLVFIPLYVLEALFLLYALAAWLHEPTTIVYTQSLAMQ